MMFPLPILASSGISSGPEDVVKTLKPLVNQFCGKAPRRTNRFTDLALTGACACVKAYGAALPERTAVLLATGRCHLSDTLTLMQQVVDECVSPTPFTFVNASSNTAGYYIARSLGLHGESTTVSRVGFPFEAALELAALGLNLGDFPVALAGGVDELVVPPDEQRQRLGLRKDSTLGEGSHWLLLGAGEEIARITGIVHVAASHLHQLEAIIQGGDQLVTGHGVTEPRPHWLRNAVSYAEATGYYETNSAQWLAGFLANPTAPAAVHINSDRYGIYCAFRVEVASSSS